MITIPSSDFKQYVVTSRSCDYAANGLCLAKSNSVVTFSFEQYKPKSISVFILRGKGSDGKVLVNGSVYVLPPNKPKKIDITDNNINVSRVDNSLGEIFIKEIILNDEDVKEDTVVMSVDFTDFLKRIGKVTGIKRTSIGLMAGEFAKIDRAGDIEELLTDPPGAYKRLGESIVFIHPCRIFSVIMKGDVKPEASTEIPYFIQEKYIAAQEEPKEAAKKNILKPAVVSNIKNVVPKIKGKPLHEFIQGSTCKVIFEAGLLKEHAAVQKSNITQVNDGIRMTRFGTYTLMASSMTPNCVYRISLRAIKVSGNGKLGIQIKTLNGEINSSKNFAVSSVKKLYSFDLKTTTPIGIGDNYCINICRQNQSATGDVIVSSLSVTQLDHNFLSSDIDVVDTRSKEQWNLPFSEKKDALFVHDSLTNFANISESHWHLPVPKIAHFYWGGRLSFMRYVSIYSFIKQNPDWKVKLHMPEVLGNVNPTWKTNEQKGSVRVQRTVEDYLHLIQKLDVEIIKHNFEIYNFKNTEHEVHKSDLLRWILLGSDGGLWSDSDIIYTQPMFFLKENVEHNKDSNTGVCNLTLNNPHRDAYAIGFLLSSKDNSFYHNVSVLARKEFNRRQYQSIGADLFNKKMGRIVSASKETKLFQIDVQNVYSIGDGGIEKFLMKNIYIQDYPNAIGFHWYGGHPKISEMEYNVNHNNFYQFDNFLGKLIRFTMG